MQHLLLLLVALEQRSNLLILGLGRVGSEVAKEARPHFEVVYGTTRSASSQGEALTFEEIDEVLPSCSHVLVTIPAPLTVDDDRYDVYRRVKEAKPSWIGILSTTGVYGDHQGEWVTEESPSIDPDTSAQAYLAYEDFWKDSGAHIFRCAGIYGNTRSALHTVYRNGVSVSSSSSVTSRIHEADIARAVVACMQSPPSRLLYNLADDEPSARGDALAYAAQLLDERGISYPNTSSPARRRRSGQKRVDNTRMKQDLVDELLFPSYREGLASIVDCPDAPWNLLGSSN